MDAKDLGERLEIAARMIAAYRADRSLVARRCDQDLDASGALLGYIRSAANREQTEAQ